MKKYHFLLVTFCLCGQISFEQNIGIGTTSPQALLHVKNGSLLVEGTAGVTPISGAGTRLMYVPAKAAFRVGTVLGNGWDDSFLGIGSFSAGYATSASGDGSVAMGQLTNASGGRAFAMGNGNTASGYESTALGSLTYAAGNSATALGDQTSASGFASTAMGRNTIASGSASIAMGYSVTADADNSIAMGTNVSTSGFTGCLTIGDNSSATVMNTFVANGMRARFAGGYRFFTNSAANVGAFLNANANSWATLSDVRLKENFVPVNGESFLTAIAAMPQFSWNYIGQDVSTLRHYGPMAQDFYKAFGKDQLGTIGCDTLINQQDFLGVNLIAIQALEKRTKTLREENDKLKNEIADLLRRLDKLEKTRK